MISRNLPLSKMSLKKTSKTSPELLKAEFLEVTLGRLSVSFFIIDLHLEHLLEILASIGDSVLQ